jgi:hypothetical protein
MKFFIPLLLLGALVFQVFVTVKLWRVDWFERKEKINQSKLIWLLPILGAVMVYSVIADEDEPGGPSSHISG